MSKRIVCLSVVAVISLAAPLITTIALVLRIFLTETFATAGLLTLTFNLTGTLSDLPFASSTRPLPQREILQDIRNGASSILSVAATRASDAASHVESAINSAVASLPQIPEIEDYVPLNCSFGIHQFCVGYRHERSPACSDSPFDISALLPDKTLALPGLIEDALKDRIGELYPLVDKLNSLPTSVSICLIAGTVNTMLALGLFSCLACDNRISRKAGLKARVLIYLSMAMACCAPYLALALIQSKVVEEAESLPAWVRVEQGDIFGYSIGLLVCALVFAALSAAASCQTVVHWMQDRVGIRENVQ